MSRSQRTVGEAGTAAGVSALARRLYGVDPGPASGILHVVAVADAPGASGSRSVMRIEHDTPKSELDFFALNFARARADAIVVTGRILREEPGLRYDLQGPGALPEGLAAWRAAAGLREPPLLVVLTSGRGLDLEHPAFHSWARPLIFTSVDAAAGLAGGPVPAVGVERPSLRGLLRHLAERGARGVSIEAGPSTAVPLYDAPLGVDELMLSVFRGPLAERLRAGAFLSAAELDRRLPAVNPAAHEGEWTFSLRRRGQGVGAVDR